MKRFLALVAITVGLVLPVAGHANSLMKASEKLCEKFKQCALEQMDQSELTPEMRQMIQPMLDGVCLKATSQIAEVAEGHPHYKAALACAESIQSLECATLASDSDMPPTKECQAYGELVGK